MAVLLVVVLLAAAAVVYYESAVLVSGGSTASQISSLQAQVSNLERENAALQSQLSSALASPRIQELAHEQDGLVQADPSTIGYIDLGKK